MASSLISFPYPPPPPPRFTYVPTTQRKKNHKTTTTIILKRYIRVEGSRTEGVFRISPSQRVVETIKAGYDAAGTVDLHKLNDVHAAASALKALLRELPEPILAETVLFRLQRLIKKHPNAKSGGDAAALSELCIALLEMLQKALSPVMLQTLTLLCELCSQLCGNRKVTKWSADGLATTIGPNLYRDTHIVDHGQLQAYMVAGNKAVAFLFEHYRTLFKPARSTPVMVRKRTTPPSPEDTASGTNPVAKPPRKSGTKPAGAGAGGAGAGAGSVGSAYNMMDADGEKAGGSPLVSNSGSGSSSLSGGGKGKKPLSAGHSLLADVLASQRAQAAATAGSSSTKPSSSPGRDGGGGGSGGGGDQATPPGSMSSSYEGLDFPDAMREATMSPGGSWNAATSSVSPFGAQRGGRRVQAAVAHAVARVLFGEWGGDGLPAVDTMSAAASGANDVALAAAWVASPMASPIGSPVTSPAKPTVRTRDLGGSSGSGGGSGGGDRGGSQALSEIEINLVADAEEDVGIVASNDDNDFEVVAAADFAKHTKTKHPHDHTY